ncbi:MAG: molybdenum ABC transporter ATP-binding protein [Aestuariibacter sp.]|nr:molybdenum ABC transporter ATP-binding protein [Aestuariibacter sp.]
MASIDINFEIRRFDFHLDVQLCLPEKGITSVVGPSGCGKTTLLRGIAGLEHCEGGFLRIGKDIWQDERTFLPTHKRPLGYVFQEASLFVHLSVLGNLEYGFKRIDKLRRKIAIERAVELLRIASLLKRRAGSLSGGERQRVAIARALTVSPKILLMDEPLAALDEEHKHEIMPYIKALHQELDIPVIYVSHSRDEVVRMSEYLVLLEQGHVKGAGCTSDISAKFNWSSVGASQHTSTMINAIVDNHDRIYRLSYLRFSGGLLCVAEQGYSVGQKIRLRIDACDVSITREQQIHTTIPDVLPAVVVSISDAGPVEQSICLRLGDELLFATVLRKSCKLLDLKSGNEVYVQIRKSTVMA